MNLIDKVNEKHLDAKVKDFPYFKAGDSIAVHVRIKEGEKYRTQVFSGMCISIKRRDNINGHFRVRKIGAAGVGIERVFPFHSPSIEKLEIVTRGKVRRAKLYNLRQLSGKKARIEIDFERQKLDAIEKANKASAQKAAESKAAAN